MRLLVAIVAVVVDVVVAVVVAVFVVVLVVVVFVIIIAVLPLVLLQLSLVLLPSARLSLQPPLLLLFDRQAEIVVVIGRRGAGTHCTHCKHNLKTEKATRSLKEV